MKKDTTTDEVIDVRRLRDEPGYRYLLQPCRIMGVDIPVPFKWDGASAPKLFRWLVAKFDRSLMSSCVHDYLCSIAKNAAERKAADVIYRQALVELEGFSVINARRAYLGARLGAWWGSGVRYPHYVRDTIWPLLGLK